MANKPNKLRNLTTAFSDTKTRVLFLVIIVIIVVGLTIGWLGIKRAERKGAPPGASVSGVPSGIQSIPGVGTPSREYIKLQEEENILRAQKAAREGTSAIPTITRTTYIGPSEFAPAIPGGTAGGAGTAGGGVADCSPEALARARASGVKAEELRCKGCNAADLKAAGYTAGELTNAGFGANELKAAGFSANELRAAGFNAEELIKAGFSPQELRAAGYSAADLVQAGVTPEQLRAAGFSASELKSAGLSAAQLAKAGYAPSELAGAGYSAAELNKVGFSPEQLAAAGFSPQQLAAAGIGVPPANMPKDCSVEALKKARAQGITAGQLRKLGCGVAALRAAGYTAKELKDAGFTAKELKDAGFSAQDLRDAGFSAADLKAAGFSAQELKDAGFSAQELKDAGFSPQELKAVGFTPADLRAAGFSPGDLRQAGFSAAELKNAGFNPAELRDAGYSAEELANAGFTADQLKTAGFTDGELYRAAAIAAPGRPSVGVAGISRPGIGGPAGIGFDQTVSGAAIGPNGRQIISAGRPIVGGEAAARTAGIDSGIGGPGDQTFRAGVQPSGAVTGVGGVPSIVSAEDANLAALEKLQQRQAEQMSMQERQDRLSQIQQAMAQQASELLQSWVPPPTQRFVASTEKTDVIGSATSAQLATAQALAAESAAPIIKAGSIMFAVLDTALNSDEPSPIMATIVTGPYKGTRLLGQFQRVDQKVVLNFNIMSVPSLATSIPINAVAIDSETARTALADHVDNHYLLRYGSLFASAFIRDYARAVELSGSTTSITLAGITTTYQDLSPGDKVLVGLGGVGRQVANSLGGLFTRPPTVTVNAGNGIGILFMADVTVNAAPIAPTTAATGGAPLTSVVAPPINPVISTAVPAVAPGAIPAATPTPIPGPPTVPTLPSAVPQSITIARTPIVPAPTSADNTTIPPTAPILR